jgi:hypothetical protein
VTSAAPKTQQKVSTLRLVEDGLTPRLFRVWGVVSIDFVSLSIIYRVRVARDATAYSGAPKELKQSEQNHGPEKRNEQPAEREIALIDRRRSQYSAQEPAAQNRSDDTDNDIEKYSLSSVRAHGNAGEPADQSAHYQPNDNIHRRSSSLIRLRETYGFVYESIAMPSG